MYEVGVQERRRSTPLPRKSVVLEVRPISPSVGYVYARVSRSRRGFSKWSYQRIKSLSLCVETSRTSAEYSAAVYEIPCPALPSVKIL